MQATPRMDGIEEMRNCMLDKASAPASWLLESPAKAGLDALPHAQDYVVTPLPTSRGPSIPLCMPSALAALQKLNSCGCPCLQLTSIRIDGPPPADAGTLLAASEKAWPSLDAWTACPWCGQRFQGRLRAFMASQLQKRLSASHDPELGLWASINAGQAFHGIGLHGAAEKLLQPALASCRKLLGAEHSLTLAAQHTLGCVLTSTRCYSEAIALLRESYQQHRLLRPMTHRDIRISLRALAWALLTSEAFDSVCEGIDLLRKEAECLHLAGFDSPEIRAEARDLERFMCHWGLLQEARSLRRLVMAPVDPAELADLPREHRLVRKSLKAMKRILGAESHDYLSIANNWAAELYEKGSYAEASRIQEEIFHILKTSFGDDSAETLTAGNNLACCYNFLGRSADALDMHREILARRQRTLGPAHPDTRKSAQNLQAALEIVNRLHEAVNAYVDEGASKQRGFDDYVDTDII